MEKNNLKNRHSQSPLIFGILLVVIGVIVLALNFGARGADLRPILFSWQMLGFIIGLLFLVNRKILQGLFVIIVAAFFAIPPLAAVFPETFAWVQPDFLKTYWAFLLVVAGLFVIVHRLLYPKNRWYSDFNRHRGWGQTSYESADGSLHREVIFSGIEEIYNEPIFKGGNLECIFGGITIDLRSAELPEGETIMRIECVFGGVVLLVPETWYVDIRTSSIFGGAADSRLKNGATDKTRKLIIAGECVFGGCEIK